ncbi:NAD(P)-dependent oxidoreductase [uncultured Tateyamaria sp.]|uniref:NAD(P)-dependent oxidoreductase n=1 Tax=uncultured Tateyamaria sp. TaxID=455651 RepID=UPI0026323790|nr:NAD(P)-dependent oxidoreductase [uncultured Tateyamaria sp.]
MTKPVLILDPDWRRMDELFSPATRAALYDMFEVIWGTEGPIPDDIYRAALPQADVLIAATPRVDADTLAQAPKLRVIIEVAGAFPDTIDYAACFAAGVEVLSCAPGFRQAVAEMGLAMALSGARGLVQEHEAFRQGRENWLADNPQTDFTLYGGAVGFVGFGQIAQELTRLLVPFRPVISVYDPWLPQEVADEFGVTLAPLESVLRTSRCVFVAAIPTSENRHLLNADNLPLLADNSLLVLLSRAHLVDFDALVAELQTGRIRACVDVFPSEPVGGDDAIRQIPAVILSPHRAAAVDKGRQLIGDLILSDLHNVRAGNQNRNLPVAKPQSIKLLSGIGDASQVSNMARSLQADASDV